MKGFEDDDHENNSTLFASDSSSTRSQTDVYLESLQLYQALTKSHSHSSSSTSLVLSDPLSSHNQQNHQTHHFLQIDADLLDKINESLQILVSAIHMYTPQKVSIAFNGGKDATVVLHLYRAALAHYYYSNLDQNAHSNNSEMHPILGLYLTQTDEFKKIEDFVAFCERKYQIKLEREPNGFYKGLNNYLSATKVQAFVMGTRRTDPDGAHLYPFTPSSPDYPKFMRVNPILHWKYIDVWKFLLGFKLPYCVLYDEGFTSLGSSLSSFQNPFLQTSSGSFNPAFYLSDDNKERAGRVFKKNQH
mmetsp:Transcript_10038/g.18092  ORF Transcript_10038/g.18092 Transcript_10038/m.18092 type:complete len:303 (+) Transcript_10038:1555-2463(+)